MSWHFSQAVVAASSAGTCLDGDVSAPSSTTITPAAFLWQDKTTAASPRSRYGMTCEPLTDARGEGVLTWCLAASLAKTSAPPAKAQALVDHDPVYGPKWRGLSVRFSRDTSGWRTAHSLFGEDLAWSSLTLPRWGSLHDGELWERTTQAPRTSATGSGCWPTPTVNDSKNNGAASQLERQSPNLNAVLGGALNPTWVEWLIGWPLGWTDCGASATDRFREWCNAHGRSCGRTHERP